MNITREAVDLIRGAVAYARGMGYEYVTPEMLLLMLCRNGRFRQAFLSCGGNLEELCGQLEAYLEAYAGSREEGGEPEFSAGMNVLLAIAQGSAANSGRGEIRISHLLHAMWQLEESYAVYYIRLQGIDEAQLLRELLEQENEAHEGAEGVKRADADPGEAQPAGGKADGRPEDTKEEEPGSSWQSFAPCLNDTLTDANPLIGREAELERTIQILCRKDKNNPLHIGEPGVGKTAITYGLVQRLQSGDVPEPIRGSRVFALDLGGMLAGTQYRGDFEKRLKRVLAEIERCEKPIIYIDEIHNLSGAGAVGESSFDASNLLKPYLAGGRIRFIGATTFEEYKKYFEKNKSLARRFQNVEIQEPGQKEAAEILEGLREKYEQFHGVHYEDGVLEYAVSMSAKHINERFLPDKAIDLMDEAGAYRKLHPEPAVEAAVESDGENDARSGGESGGLAGLEQAAVQTVGKEDIARVLTKICRVPLETVQTDDTEGLRGIEDRLKAAIFGQDEAIDQAANAIKFSRAGLLEEGKPLASLLFVGPTGVGKTEVAKCLAKELGVKLVRFDMGEYEERHSVAKLIGAPAGYVGYEEGGLLTEEIRKHPFSVLLLDEIEKAHADIYNILLSVMDYATLTDNQGRKADFRNVVLIMTSNAGANRLGKQSIGFSGGSRDDGVIMEEVKRIFQPEFRNRLNKVVVFRSMDADMAGRVVEKKLGELSVLLGKKGISLEADADAKALIQSRGTSQEFGAREVDRVIRNEVKPLFVDEMLFGKLKQGGKILLGAKGGQFMAEIRQKE